MKIKLALIALVTSLVVVPNAFAETTPFPTRQEKRIEVREQIASRQAEIRQRLNAVKRERIRNYFGKI